MASVNNTTSTTSFSYLQYKNKIGGLVSGMDVDSIMEKLMKAESAQMEKLQQQKQKYEWKRDSYREVNTKLNSFYTDAFDKFGLQSKWSSKTASVTNNTGAVSVEAKSGASGTLSISNVITAKAATSTGFGTASGLSSQRVTIKSTLANAGLDSSITLFGENVTTFGGVVKQLKEQGYNASLTNGQLKVSAGTNATELDDDSVASLKKLGLTFKQTSEKITYDKDGKQQTATSSTKLSDLNLNSGTLSININGTDKEFDLNTMAEDATLGTLLTKIKDETGLSVTFSSGNISIVGENNEEIKLSSTNASFPAFTSKIATNTGTTYLEQLSADSSADESVASKTIKGKNTIQEVLGLNTEDGSFAFRAVQADGTTKDTVISYKATDTIDSLMSKINSSGAGVTALFNNGKLNITAANTGSRADGGAEVSLIGSYEIQDSDGVYINSDDAIKLFDKLSGGKTNEFAEVKSEYTLADGGTNAKMTVNGVDYEQGSNAFNISGYTITANNDFADSSKPITISSTTDTDAAVDKVKEFVTMYNDLIKELNTKTSEKRNVNYAPLTDAQKAEMSESEITKWEEKAKAGLLKGDTNINNMLSKMRSVLNSGVGGDTLYNIGITTSSTWSDNGKLEIDENKLRTTLEKDPDVLSRIFVGTTDQPGVVSQMRTEAKTAITNIEKSAGKESLAANQYSLGKTITSLNAKIDDWKDRLKDIEERYWNQFSAMETAIQKANNQSSIFSQ